ncbi:hypothetical protein F4Z99_11555 [Candidatus Poribacteria bacterium]|nr:hypothetical protein [Candidatus Poribacteria bacterium]
MFQPKKIQIKHFENGAWWFTCEDGQEYRVTSINQNCTECLEKLHKENGGNGYMTLEKITEYYSNEYRCKVSRVPDAGWRDEDVYCLVTNETGNLNPNAERDIAQAKRVINLIQNNS